MKDKIIFYNGSVQQIEEIPEDIRILGHDSSTTEFGGSPAQEYRN